MDKRNELSVILNERVFPFVQKPARYIGNEQGTTVKDIQNIPVKFALAFPDFYELGMSHIGMGIIYDILNSKDYIACERVYLPYPDMNLKLKENKIPLFSLESYEEIRKFDIVGFSLQYELSYTNVLLMLELGGIPLFTSERDDAEKTGDGCEYPFIGAGGPCAFNPLPMSDFMDFFIIGDGEEVSVKVCDTVLAAKNKLKAGVLKRNDFRNYVKTKLSGIRGVYVPHYSKNVKKAIVYDLNSMDYIKKNIVPLIETVHNRLSVEIARGCSSGCRFCQAGYIYRPVRERKKETVFGIIKNGIASTGLGEISLSSLSTGDYSEINGLLSDIADCFEYKNISMSFPSMRIGTLSENIIQKTADVKKTNFTLAPEAGTQRLRDIINKNISEKDLIDEVEILSKKGFKSLKLYFMIGLPYEKLSDIDGIKDLIINIKTVSKRLNITVNVNNFVPKPHTPFQWLPMDSLAELTYKINYLKKLLKPLNVNIRYQNPEVSIVEGFLSRGDEFASKIIYNAFLLGGCYSSEIKFFDFALWQEAVKRAELDFNNNLFYKNTAIGGSLANKYLYEEKCIGDVLPWDFIDTMVEKKYLKKEFKKAFDLNKMYIYNSRINNSVSKKLITENCRAVCYLCGICDFKEISPVYSSKEENDIMHKKIFKKNEIEDFNDSESLKNNKNINGNINIEGKEIDEIKLLFKYSKKGEMKYLGHLETVKIFMRAFNILNLPILYSNSEFSPKPKISYSDPIPFMSESENLFLTLILKQNTGISPDNLINDININLPEGLNVLEIAKVASSFKISRLKENL